MTHHNDAFLRCLAAIARLNAEQGWGIDAVQQQAYAAALVELVPAGAGDEVLVLTIISYHADHRLVAALRAADHPEHHAAWKQWGLNAVRIIHSRWPVAAELPDLTQMALEELFKALPTYRFGSRFATWAYSVIVRRVNRARRAEEAAMRAGHVVSLSEELASDLGLVDPLGVEAPAAATALAALIAEVLVRRGGERLAHIFNLWAIEDQRLAQIGQTIGISASRVSLLVEQARTILRDDPAIRAWLDTPDDSSTEHPPT